MFEIYLQSWDYIGDRIIGSCNNPRDAQRIVDFYHEVMPDVHCDWRELPGDE